MSFTDFELENDYLNCSHDAVVILDGDNYQAPPIGSCILYVYIYVYVNVYEKNKDYIVVWYLHYVLWLACFYEKFLVVKQQFVLALLSCIWLNGTSQQFIDPIVLSLIKF